MRLWRIAAETRRYSAEDLSGGGAARYPGRWNDVDEAVVYAATSIALAVLETAGHIDDGNVPGNRFLAQVGEVVSAPIPLQSGYIQRVKEALHNREGRRPHLVQEGMAECSHRLERLLRLFRRGRAAPHHAAYCLHVQMSGEHRGGRHDEEREKAVDVFGGLLDEVAIGAEDLGGLVERPDSPAGTASPSTIFSPWTWSWLTAPS